ncbi:hypothetical protein SAMN02745121_02443 [Nannocystis exedens]|uniref:Uncharacterized protein n=1 Tax=Nannocystis exedens TaxID=54 RepID=A0A1I1WQ24_9BACT|nr:hypothetical protein [Nannocystis exedens]PCC67807.1 hypothetical protein NAEX_00815 [Nannocystis exedens]SFD95533.1 hypothetical protein SAMN02745121_02443 [Nannocystis exedens]
MPASRALLPLLLVVPACPERPSGDTETGTGPSTGQAPGTDGESSGTTVGSTTPGTGPTGTTAVPPTTGVTTDDTATTVAPSTTTDAATTDDTATTVVDPSGTTTSTTGIKLDLPAAQWPAGLVGCTLDAPAGTLLTGGSDLGPFTADRAYFGWWGFEDMELPTLLFLSPGADAAHELVERDGSTGPVYYGDVVAEPLLMGGWVGSWDVNLSVRADGMVTFPQPQGGMDILELAGNWDAADPADPPRLVGTVKGTISGPFDAVFCDKLVENIFPE